eukprot:421800_1
MQRQKAKQYPMIVKNRDKQARNTAPKQTASSDESNNAYILLDDYNPLMCKVTQWIFCICITMMLFTMTYYISISGYKNKNLSQYIIPNCSPLNTPISSLNQPQSFTNLLHTRFIPVVSISIRALKNKIDNIDLNANEWESSPHQRVTILAIIKDKRREFEYVLKQIWNKSQRKGLFEYSVADLPTKILSETKTNIESNINPYNIHFELLFNKHRIQKLQNKDTSKSHKNVKEEWNDNTFNFYEINGNNLISVIDDTLWDLNEVEDVSQNIFNCYTNNNNINWKEKHLLILNKFPIGKYSGLFIPFIGNNNNIQLLTRETLMRGIYFANMFESNDFRIGFNSMGAMASVNHLHFQFWETKSISKQKQLPIEILSQILTVKDIANLYSDEDLIIREIIGYPIHGFIYERNLYAHKQYNTRIHGISKDNIGLDINIFLNPLYYCIEYLIKNNIPHNLLINRHKIFLFVRRDETPSKYPIFYGFSDVSGWITLLNKDVYHSITIHQLWNDMKNQISIDDTKWKTVKNYCKSV